MDSNQPSTDRRRSERLFETLPLIVRGTDLLGQPFEERTTTLAFNLHGCRYTSKHHLPRNTWVTLDLAPAAQTPHSAAESHAISRAQQQPPLRARVAWVQRPHSIRDYFQIAVELESPANVWGLSSPPVDWNGAEDSNPAAAHLPARADEHNAEKAEPYTSAANLATFMDNFMTRAKISSSSSPSAPLTGPEESEQTETFSSTDNPLLRELRAELDRQAKEAVLAATGQAREEVLRTAAETDRRHSASAEELFAQWKAEIEQMQSGARAEFSAQVTATQEEALHNLQCEIAQKFAEARELISKVAHQTEALRAESGSVHEASSRVAQALLQMEAADAKHTTRPAELSKEEIAVHESAAADWRQRLDSEMTVAQGQWNELLQSSLDHSLRRMIEQLSERSQEVLHNAEQKMTERLSEMRQPFAQAAAEARDTFAGIQSSLEQEVMKARGSLAEVEQVANRTKELSAQLEAASHDTVNELHRRLEKILDSQTVEMNRRAENLSAGLSQRVGPVLDSVSHQFLERMVSEAETKLAPHLDRVPALLRELAAREVEVGESLRLHRERLRQVSENNQREVAAQMAATLSSVHEDFEAARKEALVKWGEELDACGVRASHSAAESIQHTSEWLQEEARARLQAMVEQAHVTAGAGFAEKSAEASLQFESQLASQSETHLAQMRGHLESVAGEATGRASTEMERAAAAAAGSFGQVLHEVVERETTLFSASASTTRRERTEEFERATQELLHQLDLNAFSSVERFRAQMATQLETTVGEGRAALHSEFASSLEGYRAERDAHQSEWLVNLDRMSSEAAVKFQDKLQNSTDSWIVTSVRRLNEHGQNGIESLLRSADQALRDSCSKVFEGLAEMLRERATNSAGAAGVAGFTQVVNRDTSEPPSPRNEAL